MEEEGREGLIRGHPLSRLVSTRLLVLVRNSNHSRRGTFGVVVVEELRRIRTADSLVLDFIECVYFVPFFYLRPPLRWIESS